jgi:hypothetical protein
MKRRSATALRLLGAVLLCLGVGSCYYPRGEATGSLEEISTIRMGVTYSVSVWGGHAYVTKNDGVAVLDVGEPTQPRVVAEISIGEPAFGVYTEDDLAYVTGAQGSLTIVDISDPAHPEVSGRLLDRGSAYKVRVRGPFAFLADMQEGLEIIDVSDPTKPALVGRFDDGGGLRTFEVVGDYALLANLRYGLKIVDVSIPSSPSEVANLPATIGARAIQVSGGHLFLGFHTDGLKVYDLAQPTSPQLIRELLPGKEVAGLSSSRDYLCVSLTEGRVSVMKVADATTLYEIGAYRTNNGAHGIGCDSGYVYVATLRGLAILRVLNDPRTHSVPSQ